MKKGSQLNKESGVSMNNRVPAEHKVRVSNEQGLLAEQGARGLK